MASMTADVLLDTEHGHRPWVQRQLMYSWVIWTWTFQMPWMLSWRRWVKRKAPRRNTTMIKSPEKSTKESSTEVEKNSTSNPLWPPLTKPLWSSATAETDTLLQEWVSCVGPPLTMRNIVPIGNGSLPLGTFPADTNNSCHYATLKKGNSGWLCFTTTDRSRIFLL